mgnify:CR=1 FL=1
MENSIKKDPNYADAWIWLADRKRAQHSSFSMTDKFKYMLDDASKEIDKGLILDPEHAFGYAAKLQIEFYNKNWEEMFNVAEKAYKLVGDRPHLLGKIGFSLAYGGECKKEDVFASTEKFQTVKKNRCQFQRGCWEIGKKAYELELQKQKDEQQLLEESKSDIGWGSQIRSYVLDQSRIKDLRTNVESGNISSILDGDIDIFIKASLTQGV